MKIIFIDNSQIPDKVLEKSSRGSVQNGASTSPQTPPSDDDETGNYIVHDGHKGQNGRPVRPRRLSMYEDGEAVMDPESGQSHDTSRHRD